MEAFSFLLPTPSPPPSYTQTLSRVVMRRVQIHKFQCAMQLEEELGENRQTPALPWEAWQLK